MPEEVADLRDQSRPDVVSAFSVDVEDYFHVEAFRGVVEPDDWGSMEQRVEPNTRRLLALLDEFGVQGTFFPTAVEINNPIPRLATMKGKLIAYSNARLPRSGTLNNNMPSRMTTVICT